MRGNKTPSVLVAVGVLATLAGSAGLETSTQAPFTLQPTIAFSSSRDNTAVVPAAQGLEIYITDLDGVSNARRLTANLSTDTFPALAPDGNKLTFDSNRLRIIPDEQINITDLWVMNVDGGELALLHKRAGSSTWDPQGRHIAFHASAGGAGTPIKGDIGSALTDSDIFTLNIDDYLAGLSGAVNITNDPDQVDDDPDWSPDGSRIAFTSHSTLDTGQDSETAEVWTMNPDGTGRTQLTFNNEEERAPSWSPDGTKILYMCRALWLNSGTDFEICVINADGSNLTALTNNTTPDLTPNWTPDGSRIVFHRSISGLNQLHIMNADGTDVQQLTSPPGHNLFANPGYLRIREAIAQLLRRPTTRPSNLR